MTDASLAELPLQVALALSLASSTTGADYDYLLKTAQRESSFQVDAKAASSSAEGLFQFIEETWIRTIKDEGERYGLGDYAKLIEKTDSGRYFVPNPSDRQAILALRKDPHVSAMMAGAYARRNERFLAAEIGRQPTSGELYIAHFLGAQDAVRLILVRDTQQHLSAPDLFPRAAAANRSIFYRDGKARSVGDVYDLLIRRHDRARRAMPVETASTGGTVIGNWEAEMPTIYAKSDLLPLFGNFSFPVSRRSGDAPVDTASASGRADAPALDADAWDAEIVVTPTLAALPAKPRTRSKTGATAPAEAQVAKPKIVTTNAIAGLRGRVGEAMALANTEGGTSVAVIKTIKVSSN
ncbi:MAG: lytic transglycosylase domain-containing protein [Hyphomicrobiaceae bacterium]